MKKMKTLAALVIATVVALAVYGTTHADALASVVADYTYTNTSVTVTLGAGGGYVSQDHAAIGGALNPYLSYPASCTLNYTPATSRRGSKPVFYGVRCPGPAVVVVRNMWTPTPPASLCDTSWSVTVDGATVYAEAAPACPPTTSTPWVSVNGTTVTAVNPTGQPVTLTTDVSVTPGSVWTFPGSQSAVYASWISGRAPSRGITAVYVVTLTVPANSTLTVVGVAG